MNLKEGCSFWSYNINKY